MLFNREIYFGSGRILSYLYIPHTLTIMSLDTYLLYILRDHIRRGERRVLEVKFMQFTVIDYRRGGIIFFLVTTLNHDCQKYLNNIGRRILNE